MNTNSTINNLAKQYDPDRLQRKRIKNMVFTNLNMEVPEPKQNLFDLIIMKNKFIFGTLTIAAVGIFIGLPFIASNSYRMTDLESTISSESYDVGIPATSSVQKNVLSPVMDTIAEVFERNSENEDTETPEQNRAKDKDGEISLKIDDVNQTVDDIYELTSNVGGYVVNSDSSKYNNGGRGYMIIRVPSDKFDFTIKELRAMATEVLSENINIVDIQNEITANENNLTELRKDLDAKLAELEQTTDESRKAQLDIEITRLKNQIEIYEAEANELSERASFTTISITLDEDSEEVITDDSLTEALKDAWAKTQTILLFWAKAGIWIGLVLPAVALPIVVIIVARKILKRK